MTQSLTLCALTTSVSYASTPSAASAGLPVDAPLKAALTGLELLVARAQLWQTTAAKHVSLDPQLQAVTALAGRWRRLELASWRRLLERTVDSYAAGAETWGNRQRHPWT